MTSDFPNEVPLFAELNTHGKSRAARPSRRPGGESLHISVTGRGVTWDLESAIQTEVKRLVREAKRQPASDAAPRSQQLAISFGDIGLDSAAEDGLRLKIEAALRARVPHLQQTWTNTRLGETPAGVSRRLRVMPETAGEPLQSPQDTCVCAGNVPASQYPVPDPRYLAAYPAVVGLLLYEDAVRMTIDEDASLSGCQMLVGLASEVTWAKEIAGWHLCQGKTALVTTSDTNRGPHYMLLQKAECYTGVDTILFSKAKVLNIMTGMYAFDVRTFWPFLGGKRVLFTWIYDDRGSGIWGEEAHWDYNTYDDSLLKAEGHDEVYVIYGGAKFHIPSAAVFEEFGFSADDIRTEGEASVARFPANIPCDGTLLYEHEGTWPTYVIYGGAKFLITDFGELPLLGLQGGDIRHVWQGATDPIPTVPRNGTVLKEVQGDGAVFIIRDGRKFYVPGEERFRELCLYWENVRLVPTGILAAFPDGGAA